MRDHIEFILNDQHVRMTPRADQTLLSYLREAQRLSGTKEGCGEGDCGACTVLLGRVRDGELVYHAINACIVFLPMLDGAHIVTIEALAKDGQLHWVQQALVDYHGTQCGFCTPGIVISLYAMWMNNPNPDRKAIETALQGNLCRCTGYASILRGISERAPDQELAQDPLVKHRTDMQSQLAELPKDSVHCDNQAAFWIPNSVDELAQIYDAHPNARLIAGASDVGLWVTKGLKTIDPVIYLHNIPTLETITKSSDAIQLGAMVRIDQAARALEAIIPEISDFLPRFAGQQLRNIATIGGNIGNASPIGDLPPLLIALDARLVLQNLNEERVIPIEDYFLDYGKQDRNPGEFISRIDIPLPVQGEIKAYKLSKRPDEDISAVMGAIRIVTKDMTITDARIAFGGMAATPKCASATEAILINKPVSETNIRQAMEKLAQDFSPISDMRASADYRMRTAQNMLLGYYWDVLDTGDNPN